MIIMDNKTLNTSEEAYMDGVKDGREEDYKGLDCLALFEKSETKKIVDSVRAILPTSFQVTPEKTERHINDLRANIETLSSRNVYLESILKKIVG